MEIGGDGHVFDEYAYDHECGAEYAGEANTQFVENDAAEEEHQEEHIDEAVATGEETIIAGAPSETAFRGGSCEDFLERGEQIRDIVAHHHGEGHNDEGCPTSRCGIVELLHDGFCNVHCCEREGLG